MGTKKVSDEQVLTEIRAGELVIDEEYLATISRFRRNGASLPGSRVLLKDAVGQRIGRTLRELGEHLGIAPRSVKYRIERLQQSGVPIRAALYGYVVDDPGSLPDPPLPESERHKVNWRDQRRLAGLKNRR